jgi:hypothetical protein
MARLTIAKEQVPYFINTYEEFRWGSMTGYKNHKGDYIVKVFGEVVASWTTDKEGNQVFRLDDEWALDDKYVPLIMRGYFFQKNGLPTERKNIGN